MQFFEQYNSPLGAFLYLWMLMGCSLPAFAKHVASPLVTAHCHSTKSVAKHNPATIYL